jgi:hypothetical protein
MLYADLFEYEAWPPHANVSVVFSFRVMAIGFSTPQGDIPIADQE